MVSTVGPVSNSYPPTASPPARPPGTAACPTTGTSPPAPARDRAARLRAWGDRFLAGLAGVRVDDPILPAVLHTLEVFQLDRADFAAFLRSMAMDLTVAAYPTYGDLLEYMEGSAAVIGT